MKRVTLLPPIVLSTSTSSGTIINPTAPAIHRLHSRTKISATANSPTELREASPRKRNENERTPYSLLTS